MPLKASQVEDVFSTTDEDVKCVLANILYLNVGTNSSEKVVISSVNKLLSVSKTRSQGLEFLNLLISICSPTIIAEHAVGWVSHCLIKYPGDSLKELKLTTIGKIIKNVYSEQEFTKKFISDYIAIVLDNCLSGHINSFETEAALGTLTTCMIYYPSWFAPHKLKIETFLIGFLEDGSEKLVEKAALAFHFLQQVGGAGADGINHRNNFSIQFQKLCSTVQKLFDTFLENETEIDHSDRSNQDMFHFIAPPHYSQNMLHVTTRRIRNCLKFIMTMLLKNFPVAKEIKAAQVIDVVNRGTAIHKCLSMDIEKSIEEVQFSLLLNKVQIQLLQLLRIFIIWLQANALPFSFTISKILIDCVNKSQNCQCFAMDSIYQETVYRVLSCWLRMSKNAVHAHFQTQLVMCILKDMTPVKSQITLSLQSDTPKNKSAKAKRKAIQERIISSGQGSNSNGSLSSAEKLNKERNCLFALNTLKQLLSATTLRIKANVLQDLYTTVINIMVDIQLSKFNHPYTNINCQAKLYEVLVAFYEQDSVKITPPLQVTLDILNKGVNNNNRHIAITCEYGLSILEKLCQPVCPSLFLPKFSMIKDVKLSQEFINDKLVGELCEESNVDTEKKIDFEQNYIGAEENADEVLDVDIDLDTEAEVTTHAEDGTSEDYLLQDKSIHIIDVQVLSTSFTDNLGNKQTKIDDITKYDINKIDEDSPIANVGESSNIREEFTIETSLFKKEVHSNTSIELCNLDTEVTSATELQLPSERVIVDEECEGEPPLKKHRNDEDTGGLADRNIKVEQKSFDDMDSRFEEDDAFVDEIKEY